MGDGRFLNITLVTDELHRRIGLGIPLGSLMLIEGEDGAGKSLVSQRLLYGFLRNGHSATYICSELTTKDFLGQMRSLRYDISPYLPAKKLLYIPMFPRIGKVVPREDFLERLMKAKELFSNEAVIIDTLNSLMVERFSREDIFKLISFFKRITNMEKTAILTVNPLLFDENALNIIRSVCDIQFRLAIKQIAGEIKRSINIYRFRGASMQTSSTIGFRAEPKVGFVMEISAIA